MWRLHAQFAYTVMGRLGEVEFETFNGLQPKPIRKNIHPGTAKGKMNANLIMEFAALLPTEERPEKTEGYEGFYHLTDMGGRGSLTCLYTSGPRLGKTAAEEGFGA